MKDKAEIRVIQENVRSLYAYYTLELMRCSCDKSGPLPDKCPSCFKRFDQYRALWRVWIPTSLQCNVCCEEFSVTSGHFPLCAITPTVCIQHCRPTTRNLAEHVNAHHRADQLMGEKRMANKECICLWCLDSQPSESQQTRVRRRARRDETLGPPSF
jgi:hypothetical protein